LEGFLRKPLNLGSSCSFWITCHALELDGWLTISVQKLWVAWICQTYFRIRKKTF